MVLNLKRDDNFQRISIKSLILMGIIILATVTSVGFIADQVTADSQAYPAKGTWKGPLSGKGTILKKYYINLTGTMEGSFDGDTSQGTWTGIYMTTYKIWPVTGGTVTEQEVGEIKGTYRTTIDSSGSISGESIVKLTGPLEGDLKIQIKGSESPSGDLKGTYSGTTVRDSFSYGGTPVSVELTVDVAGEFEGKTTKPSPSESPPTTQTTTPTTTIIPTTTTIPPSTPQPKSDGTQNLQYTIIAIIIIGIAIGAYFVKARGSSKKSIEKNE